MLPISFRPLPALPLAFVSLRSGFDVQSNRCGIDRAMPKFR
jgi:hypothetical protein